jgi:hypothetical protein
MWDMVYRYGHLPYRSGHPGYRYGIWSHDMGDDRIDMVISHGDMGYLVTLPKHRTASPQSREKPCNVLNPPGDARSHAMH